jgi:metal-responsive CopG/Arc/MetJ family transcriptional regulator
MARTKIQDKTTISIKFESDIYKSINEYAKANEMDKSKVIRLAVRKLLDQPEKKRIISKAS